MTKRFVLCCVVFSICAGAFAQQTNVNYTWSHFAGPSSGPGSADGAGSAAQFAEPNGLAVDQFQTGNVYVADTWNHTIRQVTPAGVVTTLAGQPTVPGFADGTGSAARFSYPYALTVGTDGTIYVADGNLRVRKVTGNGVVSTFAGKGAYGAQDGQRTSATFRNLTGLTVDRVTGNLYVADDETIRKIT